MAISEIAELMLNPLRQAAPAPHVAHNSGNNEWYTPAELVELAREVMGSIDLDPASCAVANEVVRAQRYFSVEDNGLRQRWEGNVWLNPPYSGDLVTRFVGKLRVEVDAQRVTQAIVLVNNATETKWFCSLAEISSAIVFPTGRVKFHGLTGKSNSPLQGQAFAYVGNEPARFLRHFKPLGWGALLSPTPKWTLF